MRQQLILILCVLIYPSSVVGQQVGDVIIGAENNTFALSGGISRVSPATRTIVVVDTFFGDAPFSLGLNPAGALVAGMMTQIFAYNGASRSSLTSNLAGGQFVTGIAFDAAGNMYASTGAGGRILEYSSASNLLRTFVLSTPPGSIVNGIDLAADQCTMYFASPPSPRVQRYDVCRSTGLSDLAVVPAVSAIAMRVLLDGSVLVAAGTAAYRYAASGVLLRTYAVPGATDGWNALAVAPDMTSFWVATNIGVCRLDVSSGTLVDGPILGANGSGGTVSLAVVGEQRAATAPTAIPTFSEVAFTLLLLSLAAVGVRTIR